MTKDKNNLPFLPEKFESKSTIVAEDILAINNEEILKNFVAPTKGCVFGPLKKLLEVVEKELKVKEGPRIINPVYVNDEVAFFLGFVGFGSPMWTWVFEQLIALGIKKFVYIGVFGKVNPEYDNDSIYVVTKALRDEGTSRHYTKSDDAWAYPDKELTDELLKLGAKKASIWTVDVMFKQTFVEVEYAKKNGIAGFEMECSALFTVAKEKGVQIASLQAVSDYYIKGKHTSIFKTEKCQSNLEKALHMALEVLDVKN